MLYGAPNMPVSGSNDNERFHKEIFNEMATAIMIHEVRRKLQRRRTKHSPKVRKRSSPNKSVPVQGERPIR